MDKDLLYINKGGEMMERLTYRGSEIMTEDGWFKPSYSCYSTKRIIERLTEYEDLEEQGLLLRLPVKMGDTVYFLGRKCDKCEEDYCYRCPYNRNGEKRDDIFVYNMVVKQFRIYNNSVYIVDTDAVWSSSEISLNIKQFGKTVFLTKEEAEQKLKEMEM